MSVIKRTLLLFWAAWLSVVATTNVLDGLRTLGTLPESFQFISGNWQWINQVMDPIAVPRSLQATLFVGVIGWEALGALLFWWAVASYRGRPLMQEQATLFACGVNLALWSTFQVLDEVFLAYVPEGVHRVIFLNQIATLLVLDLLPSQARRTDMIEPDSIRAGDDLVATAPGPPRV
ncbi:hypothetical protein V5E97_05455 [Singulisphaera sp. Ch08]|uniref:Uncharacterized protein n=1 Tax=Singulisphaera sp. Ch08 TaxID=3120278 RepID=A0AAU7CJQ5_9BACT